MNKIILIVSFVILHSSLGQLVDQFKPNVKQYTRKVINVLTDNDSQKFSTTSEGYSNTFAAAVNSVTWMPQTLAKALGHVSIPLPNSENKRFDIVGFIADYIKGFTNEDARLHIKLLIEKYGFNCETHIVETEDGFLLTMYRIPAKKGPSVLLMHGLFGSSDDFVVAGRNSALAYLLADEGYDVWLGNVRGNKHSRNHTRLDPSEAEFWDYSYHDIGMYDLPALVDYILNYTKKPTLSYVAYSQGNTIFYVMNSEMPEYNEKFSLMVAIAPVAFCSKLKSPLIRLLSPISPFVQGFLKTLGLHEFMPDNSLIKTLKLWVCGSGPLADILCTNSVFFLTGFDYAQLNITNLRVIYGHHPSGGSVKQLTHYAQGFNSGEFRKFDYGCQENIARYGVDIPPSYNLENVVAPIAMIYSEADWMADARDVEKLYQRLPNVVDLHKIPNKWFNHADYLFAKDVKKFVNSRVIDLLSAYS